MKDKNKTKAQLIVELEMLRERERELEALVLEQEQKIDDLQKRLHFLDSITNLSPNPIFVKNRKGQFTLVNDAFARLFGRTVEEVIGMFDADFLTPEKLEEARRRDTEVMETQRVITGPVVQRTYADGETRRVQTTKLPILGVEGNCNQILGVMKDVTNLMEVEAALQLTRFTVESMADAMYWMDSEARFVDVNEAACRTLGYPREELLNLSLFDITSEVTVDRWRNTWKQLRKNGKFTRETTHRAKDGRIIPVEIVANFIEFEGRELDCAIVRDITERKETEESLRLTRFMVEHMSDAVYWIDSEARIVDVNKAACHMLGYTREELTHMSVLDIDETPPFENIKKRRDFRESLRQADMIRFETRHRTKDGRSVPVEIVANLIQFADQEINCCFVRDMTERKQAEAALQESEEKYRSLVESAQDPIFTCDAEGHYLFVNTIAAANFGTTPAKMVGKSIHDLFPAHIAERYLKNIKQVIETGNGLISDAASEINGRPFWLSINMQPIRDRQGHIKAVQAVVRDISDLKQAEEALRESEERLRQAVRVSHIGIFDHDHLTDTIYWSPELREIYGWGLEEKLPTLPKVLNYVHPEDIERIKKAVRQAHDPAGDGLYDVENRIVRRDGTIRWLSTRSKTFFEGEGSARHPVRTVGAVLDVTESREAAQALWESERQNRALVEAVPDLLFRIDREGIFLDYRAPQETTLFTPPETFLGKAVRDVMPPHVAEPAMKAVTHSLRIQDLVMFEYALMINEEERYFEGRTVPLSDSEVLVVVRDITERKRTEQMLQTLNTAALAMQRAITPDQIFIAVADELKKIGFHCTIFTTSGGQRRLIPKYLSFSPQSIEAAENLTGLKVDDFTIPTAQIDVFRLAIRERQATFIEDVQESVRQFLPEPFKKLIQPIVDILQITKSINTPLIVDDEVIGLFSVQSKDLRQNDVPAIMAFANQLAAAWRQSQLFEQVQQELVARKQAEAEIRRLNAELEQRVEKRTQQLQEALTFQEEIMRASSTGITVYDASGQCVLANEASAKMIDASLAQIVRQNYQHIKSWRKLGLYETALEAVESGLEQQQDVHIVTSFDREVWLNCRFVPFSSGGQSHLLLTVNDMTERIQAETEIRELNRQLQAQANNLAAANKELEAFSYSVSHDLRAPLRAIDGFTRILLEDYGPVLDAEGKRVCGVIHSETQRMDQLINDLLAFSHLSRTNMQAFPIDMQALVTSVFHELTTHDDQERIDFHIAPLPAAMGDRSLIRQVWLNLLTNAIKFSAKQKRAVVEVGSQQRNGEVVYYVRDNGAGFDMQYADKLFGVFQRLHSEREFEGTGVGLAIVQRAIHRHGGRVWAEGQVDQGATFYFTLPQEAEQT